MPGPAATGPATGHRREDSTTSWFSRITRARRAEAPADDHARLDDQTPRFVCSACGRTDLPAVGGWDPPICEECDAAINEDAMLEAEDLDDR
jgi:hypothetical protein